MSVLLTNAVEWRLSCLSVTVYQDGPDLSNQGTVAACQYPVRGRKLTAYPAFTAGTNASSAAGGSSSVRRLFQLGAEDLPSYEKSQQMPNAMFGESKNGFYMPGRLGPNHQKWMSETNCGYYVCAPSTRTAKNLYPQVPWYSSDSVGVESTTFPCLTADLSSLVWPDNGSTTANAGTFTQFQPPHPACPSFSWVGTTNVAATCKVAGARKDCLQLPQLCDQVGSVCFRNLAVTTGIQLYFRVGIEAQVRMGSAYAPYLRVAPAYDPDAVDAYYKLSRELKDAYPVEYNDLGKLWDVIKNAARTILPAIGGGLSMIPGPVGMVARMVTPAITGMLGSSTNTAPRDKPPAAALERAQEYVRSSTSSSRAPRSRSKSGSRKKTVRLRSASAGRRRRT